jgi:hypothetical protein
MGSCRRRVNSHGSAEHVARGSSRIAFLGRGTVLEDTGYELLFSQSCSKTNSTHNPGPEYDLAISEDSTDLAYPSPKSSQPGEKPHPTVFSLCWIVGEGKSNEVLPLFDIGLIGIGYPGRHRRVGFRCVAEAIPAGRAGKAEPLFDQDLGNHGVIDVSAESRHAGEP